MIQIKEKTNELAEILKAIEFQSSFHFSYDPQKISKETKIDLPSKQVKIVEVLEVLKKTHGIRYIIQDNVIILQRNKKKADSSSTINGVIRDATTGELLPAAQIVLAEHGEGVSSNQYGFYSLSLPPPGKKAKIQVRYLGYSTSYFDFHFNQDTIANISLIPEALLLEDVSIVSQKKDSIKNVQISAGTFTISGKKIKETTSLAGEPDALKSLQFLPGVQSGNEGTANLSVRGGSFDQNLFILDEAPIYNPSHALGFFSIFNSDAIKTVSLYKSSIPVSYGGRLSSVVDVRMKEGNNTKMAVSGAVGAVASRLTLEGPVAKNNDKISFMASGRYSYAGHIVNGMYVVGSFFGDPTSNNTSLGNKINFYDLNLKLNYKHSKKDHFYFSAYSGHDDFHFMHFTSGYSLAWGNKTGTFRWNHIHSSRLFSNTTAVYSNYQYQYKILNNTQYFLWNSDLKEFTVKQDYDYYLDNDNHITFGAGIESHWINPGQVSPRSSEAVTQHYALERQRPMGTYLYLSNEQKIGEKWMFNYGVRYSNLILYGPTTRYLFDNQNDYPYDSVSYGRGKIEKVFHRLDPRISIALEEGKHTITASYDRTTQYFHLLANSSVGLPTDIWMPSGGSIKPQTADIFALSYQPEIGEFIEVNVAIFYKYFNNILDFKDHADLFVNKYVESQLLQGYGEAYGFETFLQRTYGRFTGTASYTWSKVSNTINGVNEGNAYPSRYDKRNNISTTGKITLSKHWEASFNFIYTTGAAITLPKGSFRFEGVEFTYYTDRNTFRLPDYHRLDLSVRRYSRRNDNRRYKSHWALDIYNVYGRNNPFTIYSQPNQKTLTALYLYNIVPTLGYNFSF